jgi:hypothetical protein
LIGTTQRDFEYLFTTIGGNLAWLTISHPHRFHILFTGCPLVKKEGCRIQTLLFLPAKFSLRSIYALISSYIFLQEDNPILNTISFRPGFTENDVGMKAFAEIVNATGSW